MDTAGNHGAEDRTHAMGLDVSSITDEVMTDFCARLPRNLSAKDSHELVVHMLTERPYREGRDPKVALHAERSGQGALGLETVLRIHGGKRALRRKPDT